MNRLIRFWSFLTAAIFLLSALVVVLNDGTDLLKRWLGNTATLPPPDPVPMPFEDAEPFFSDLSARLAPECADDLIVYGFGETTLDASETTHGFPGAYKSASFTLQDTTETLRAEANGRGPSAATDAYGALLDAATLRIRDSAPSCLRKALR